MSLGGLLNIARTSLYAHQLAINVTGSNVANVNTPGYSRQRPDITSVGSGSIGAGSLQSGVEIDRVRRLFDSYLESQIVGQSQKTGYSKEMKDILGRIETVFEESRGGRLNDNLNRFWNSWGDLAANPEGIIEKYTVLSVSETLSSSFREYDETLEIIKRDTTSHLGEVVSKVNVMLSNLADLNVQMMNYGRDDGSGNHIKDQRTEMLKELGGYLAIDYIEDERGFITAFLPNGMPVLEGIISYEMKVNDQGNIHFKGRPDEIINDVISKDGRGQLGAMLSVRDTLIPDYLAELGRLAGAIIEEVNRQHRAGYDLGGVTGVNFFNEPMVGVRASSNMSLNISDPRRVAVSATVNKDGYNARLIADIKDRQIINGAYTVNQFYASLVGRVGHDLAEAVKRDSHHVLVMNNMINRKEQVSGVAIDEEMMNLIRFQMGYNAAGRLVAAANELLDTLMNLGR